MRIEQEQDNPLWYCAYCGDDFRAWRRLPGEVRREFLRQRSDDDMTRLLDNCCPRCGTAYMRVCTEPDCRCPPDREACPG